MIHSPDGICPDDGESREHNMAKLTPKQKKFCKEYLVDLCATQAAIRAGYSKRTARSQGSRLLMHVDIADEIDRLGDEISAKTMVTAESVVLRLNQVAERSMRARDYANTNRALDLLGRTFGLYTDKHEISGAGGGPIDMEWVITIVDVDS